MSKLPQARHSAQPPIEPAPRDYLRALAAACTEGAENPDPRITLLALALVAYQGVGDRAGGETSDGVLEYLDAQGDGTPALIAAALHKSFKSVWNALLRLQGKGKVARRGKKWELVKR